MFYQVEGKQTFSGSDIVETVVGVSHYRTENEYVCECVCGCVYACVYSSQ